MSKINPESSKRPEGFHNNSKYRRTVKDFQKYKTRRAIEAQFKKSTDAGGRPGLRDMELEPARPEVAGRFPRGLPREAGYFGRGALAGVIYSSHIRGLRVSTVMKAQAMR